MVDDPQSLEMDSEPSPAEAKFGPRVAFQIIPTALANPPPATTGQAVFAGLLVLLLFASCLQLSLVANVAKLPQVGRGVRVRLEILGVAIFCQLAC